MAEYEKVRKKYSNILNTCFKYIIIYMYRNKNLKLTHIDENALRIWEDTWISSDRDINAGGWPWPELFREFRQKTAKYFDLAIWHSGTLCGLVIGRLSPKNEFCNIYYMEAAPYNHPLKGQIMLLTTDIARTFISSVDGKAIRFMDPDMRLRGKYENAGFIYYESSKVQKRLKRNQSPHIHKGETFFEMRVR